MSQRPITLETIVARAEGLIAADLDGETILLGVEQGAYFGLEATAQNIWQAIEHPHRVKEIVTSLTARYAVDEAECAAQTCAFLDQLVGEGFVQIVEDFDE